MPKQTIADLQTKLEQANRIIAEQQQQISDLHKQYANITTKQEYDGLLRQYHDLEERYNILQSLYSKKQSKKHNERGAGRKPKLNDDLITQIHKLKNENGMTIQAIAKQLNISVGLAHRACKMYY